MGLKSGFQQLATSWRLPNRYAFVTAFGLAAMAASSAFSEDAAVKGILANMTPDQTGRLNDEQAATITYQIDPNRVVKLNEDVSDEVATKIKDKLYALAKKDPKADIVLEINSGGGQVEAGWAILDAINAIPNKVHTLCGRAESMAAVILISNVSGNRYAYPHCRIMLHEPSVDASGNTSALLMTSKDMELARNEFNKMISRASGMDTDTVQDFISSGDTIITPEQAYKLNFIDGILPERTKSARPMRKATLSEDFCMSERKRRMSICSSGGPTAGLIIGNGKNASGTSGPPSP